MAFFNIGGHITSPSPDKALIKVQTDNARLRHTKDFAHKDSQASSSYSNALSSASSAFAFDSHYEELFAANTLTNTPLLKYLAQGTDPEAFYKFIKAYTVDSSGQECLISDYNILGIIHTISAKHTALSYQISHFTQYRAPDAPPSTSDATSSFSIPGLSSVNSFISNHGFGIGHGLGGRHGVGSQSLAQQSSAHAHGAHSTNGTNSLNGAHGLNGANSANNANSDHGTNSLNGAPSFNGASLGSGAGYAMNASKGHGTPSASLANKANAAYQANSASAGSGANGGANGATRGGAHSANGPHAANGANGGRVIFLPLESSIPTAQLLTELEEQLVSGVAYLSLTFAQSATELLQSFGISKLSDSLAVSFTDLIFAQQDKYATWLNSSAGQIYLKRSQAANPNLNLAQDDVALTRLLLIHAAQIKARFAATTANSAGSNSASANAATANATASHSASAHASAHAGGAGSANNHGLADSKEKGATASTSGHSDHEQSLGQHDNSGSASGSTNPIDSRAPGGASTGEASVAPQGHSAENGSKTGAGDGADNSHHPGSATAASGNGNGLDQASALVMGAGSSDLNPDGTRKRVSSGETTVTLSPLAATALRRSTPKKHKGYNVLTASQLAALTDAPPPSLAKRQQSAAAAASLSQDAATAAALSHAATASAPHNAAAASSVAAASTTSAGSTNATGMSGTSTNRSLSTGVTTNSAQGATAAATATTVAVNGATTATHGATAATPTSAPINSISANGTPLYNPRQSAMSSAAAVSPSPSFNASSALASASTTAASTGAISTGATSVGATAAASTAANTAASASTLGRANQLAPAQQHQQAGASSSKLIGTANRKAQGVASGKPLGTAQQLWQDMAKSHHEPHHESQQELQQESLPKSQQSSRENTLSDILGDALGEILSRVSTNKSKDAAARDFVNAEKQNAALTYDATNSNGGNSTIAGALDGAADIIGKPSPSNGMNQSNLGPTRDEQAAAGQNSSRVSTNGQNSLKQAMAGTANNSSYLTASVNSRASQGSQGNRASQGSMGNAGMGSASGTSPERAASALDHSDNFDEYDDYEDDYEDEADADAPLELSLTDLQLLGKIPSILNMFANEDYNKSEEELGYQLGLTYIKCQELLEQEGASPILQELLEQQFVYLVHERITAVNARLQQQQNIQDAHHLARHIASNISHYAATATSAYATPAHSAYAATVSNNHSDYAAAPPVHEPQTNAPQDNAISAPSPNSATYSQPHSDGLAFHAVSSIALAPHAPKGIDPNALAPNGLASEGVSAAADMSTNTLPPRMSSSSFSAMPAQTSNAYPQLEIESVEQAYKQTVAVYQDTGSVEESVLTGFDKVKELFMQNQYQHPTAKRYQTYPNFFSTFYQSHKDSANPYSSGYSSYRRYLMAMQLN